MLDPSHKYAWAKFNAYGALLAVLAILGIGDLIDPGGADLTRLNGGHIPPGHTIWVTAFVLAGLFLLYGFIGRDRLAETAGLLLLTIGILCQAVVAFSLLGWTSFTTTRLVILAMVAWVTWARMSVLWSREGLTFTVPPRKGPHHPDRRH